jgi:hypothetical protein
MFDENKPTADELPSTRQLIRSTLIALEVAIVILVVAVLPAEYAVDPTGIGRVLGLTQMGEIKVHAQEATGEGGPAPAHETPAKWIPQAMRIVPPEKTDEMTIALRPGQGTEVKVEMDKGTRVDYRWSANGGELLYDTHGEPHSGPKNFSHGYGKGSAPRDEGVLEARFDGHHGWYWKNTTKKLLKVTLRVKGRYRALKRLF